MSSRETSNATSKKPPKAKKGSPPITRQRSKHNQETATNTKELSESQESDFLYASPSQASQNTRPITLTTPESQKGSIGRESPRNLLTGTTNQSEENMEMDELSSSACELNLSGILNQTMEGTSEMLKLLDEEDHVSTSKTQPNQTNLTLLDEKAKQLKASLIILAKASHHRTFMETCLHAKTPPRNMCLWVEPHIYHTSKETEKEWKDTLITASLKLLGTLVKHYSKIIEEEKDKLKTTIDTVTTYLKNITDKQTRDTETQNWKELKQAAEGEAKTIGENLREQRNKKLTQRKRKREKSMEDLTPQPKKSFVEALRGLMNEFRENKQTETEHTPKNENAPRRGAGNYATGRGKGPANGRSYVKKTWPTQRR